MKNCFLILILFFFVKGISQNAEQCHQLITCFKQGARGNCASVALIKASISAYGIDGVFSMQKLTDTSDLITLKNGKQYILMKSEISAAKISADFKKINANADPVIDYSNKCYAVMALVRMELEGLSSYTEALKRLERGAYTPNVYRYLGLETKVRILKKRAPVDDLSAVVAWRTKHAVFCCSGHIDEHGTEVKLKRKYYGRFEILK